MSEEIQATTRTDVDPNALYLAVRIAWRAQVGTEPSRAQLLTLMAQSDLETGSWRACMNYNLAGIKHVAGDGHDYASYQTHEVLNGQTVTIVQTFRAYPTLDAGVADWLALLRGRFGYAWPAIEAADVADFAHRLHARGYYTAPEQQYAAGLRARYAALDAKILPETEPDLAPSATALLEPDDGGSGA